MSVTRVVAVGFPLHPVGAFRLHTAQLWAADLLLSWFMIIGSFVLIGRILISTLGTPILSQNIAQRAGLGGVVFWILWSFGGFILFCCCTASRNRTIRRIFDNMKTGEFDFLVSNRTRSSSLISRLINQACMGAKSGESIVLSSPACSLPSMLYLVFDAMLGLVTVAFIIYIAFQFGHSWLYPMFGVFVGVFILTCSNRSLFPMHDWWSQTVADPRGLARQGPLCRTIRAEWASAKVLIHLCRRGDAYVFVEDQKKLMVQWIPFESVLPLYQAWYTGRRGTLTRDGSCPCPAS